MKTTTAQSGAMPFLMDVTPVTRMEECPVTAYHYDDITQTVYYMGGQTVGTKSFAVETTIKKGGGHYSDPKNKIDDTKRK